MWDDYRKVPTIRYPLYTGIPYIRVHFINDQCAIVGADIYKRLLSSPSSFIFIVSLVLSRMCLLMKFFGSAWYHMGFPDRGPFDLNLVGTLNIM